MPRMMVQKALAGGREVPGADCLGEAEGDSEQEAQHGADDQNPDRPPDALQRQGRVFRDPVPAQGCSAPGDEGRQEQEHDDTVRREGGANGGHEPVALSGACPRRAHFSIRRKKTPESRVTIR